MTAEELMAFESLTDDDCADFILAYLKNFGKKDMVFKRILLRMIERDGIRETVKGLIQNRTPTPRPSELAQPSCPPLAPEKTQD